MESNVVWLLLLTAGVTQGQPSPSTVANEYYVGFFKNILGQGTMTLFITTTESVPVPFTVSSSTGQIYSGNATNSEAVNITLPSSFAILNNTVRDKGVWVRATDASRKLTVHGMNYASYTVDGFVALPCYDYRIKNFTYFAVSTHFNRTSEELISEVLLIGCENDTELTIAPTQTIEIPSDLVRESSFPISVTSGGSYTVTLDGLQTFLLSSTLDLTGSKVTSNKPIAFFSGHECADVPVGVEACDHLVEQLPPTITWGRQFYVASSLGKTAGEQYKVITSTATTTVVCYCYNMTGRTLSETFITTLNGAGTSYEFHIAQNMFCSVQASSPTLLVQFAIGAAREPAHYGDPFMMMIPPVEQYSNNYTFVTQLGFQNAITVTVEEEFFNSEDIFLNGSSLNSANWTEIYCSNQTVCAYGTRVSLSVGTNFIYHRDATARLGTFVYGFLQNVGYGYPAGMQLIPISVDCSPPDAPQNGSLESYTGTTHGSEVFYSCDPGLVPKARMRAVCTENGWSPNPGGLRCTVVDCGPPVGPWNGSLESYSTKNGSEVFYSCDPGLLPEGRMRSVCTENGWSPNPADLNCTVATTTHVIPSMYHHMTTLDSRAQPVATEHAVPTLPQVQLPLVIGLAGGGGMSTVIVTSLIIVLCIIMKRRRARNMSTSDTQRGHIDIKMIEHEYEDVAHEYEVPVSMIKMKECEAYAPLPYKP